MSENIHKLLTPFPKFRFPPNIYDKSMPMMLKQDFTEKNIWEGNPKCSRTQIQFH